MLSARSASSRAAYARLVARKSRRSVASSPASIVTGEISRCFFGRFFFFIRSRWISASAPLFGWEQYGQRRMVGSLLSLPRHPRVRPARNSSRPTRRTCNKERRRIAGCRRYKCDRREQRQLKIFSLEHQLHTPDDFIELILAKLRIRFAEIRPGMNIIDHQLEVVAVDVVVETAGNGMDPVAALLPGV